MQEGASFYNVLGESFLQNMTNRDYLRDQNASPLFLEGFKLYNYRLHFRIENNELYNILKDHDFKQYIKNRHNNDVGVLKVIEKQLLKSKETITSQQVGIEGFTDEIIFSILREQTYRIRYFELESDN